MDYRRGSKNPAMESDPYVAYSIARKKPSSESIQKWFSDYSMLLIRNGDSPDDLDFNIMSKV